MRNTLCLPLFLRQWLVGGRSWSCRSRSTAPFGFGISVCCLRHTPAAMCKGEGRREAGRGLQPDALRLLSSHRMTLAYFCLGALDLLGLVDGKLDIEERREYIDWIYDQQMKDIDGGGFRSSPFAPTSVAKSNLAMTYTAILNLAILRDDLIRLDRRAVLSQLRSLQQPDGRCVDGNRDKSVAQLMRRLHAWTALPPAWVRPSTTVALCIAPLPSATCSMIGAQSTSMQQLASSWRAG